MGRRRGHVSASEEPRLRKALKRGRGQGEGHIRWASCSPQKLLRVGGTLLRLAGEPLSDLVSAIGPCLGLVPVKIFHSL